MPIIIVATLWALAKAALIAGSLAAGAYLLVMHWQQVVNWFQQYRSLLLKDKDNLAFSLLDRLENGHYKTVFGVLNRKQGTIVAGQMNEAEDIDDTMRQIHNGEQLVVLN